MSLPKWGNDSDSVITPETLAWQIPMAIVAFGKSLLIWHL